MGKWRSQEELRAVSDVRKSLCAAGKHLAEKGMVHSNLGTISAIVDRGKDLYIAKSGHMRYQDAEPKDFVELGLDGVPKDAWAAKSSLNWLVHAKCYIKRPDIGAVVHAHPRHLVMLVASHRNQNREEVIPLLTGEAVWHVKPVRSAFKSKRPGDNRDASEIGIPIVDDLAPAALAVAVGSEIIKANVVAIRNHGVMAVGKNIDEALAAAIVAEEEAACICGIYAMNRFPDFLSAERVWRELEAMPDWFSKPFHA